jgi:hypothetical protein
MDYSIGIEAKDNPDRNRFWETVKRFEQGTDTGLERRNLQRLADKYFDSITNYEDAAIITWELHYWRRLPVGASLIVFCGGPNCVNPDHMRMEVPKHLCKVCCEDSPQQRGEELGN